jgi:hypothetical protein
MAQQPISIRQTITLISPLIVQYYAGWNSYRRARLAAGTVVEIEMTNCMWGVTAHGRRYTATPKAVMVAVGQI